jgi:hypothetical protein
MNYTFALRDLETSYALRFVSGSNLERDFRVREIDGSREGRSEGYSAGGSKIDGTNFSDLRYFFSLSRRSGST